jgi:nucleotide-binding universal stress UspA family protein
MKSERILLPVDVARCPLEVFELVNGLAKRPEVTIILLHVVSLNILAPENRVYEELGQEAQWYLENLANKHIPPMASTIAHVRVGNPAEEILAEAKAESVDLIILPTYGPSFWNRLKGLWTNVCIPSVSTLAERVIREATCGVFVVLAKTRLNCERAWGRPVKNRKAQSIVPSRPISPAYESPGLSPLRPRLS